jgi:hypothetical protein
MAAVEIPIRSADRRRPQLNARRTRVLVFLFLYTAYIYEHEHMSFDMRIECPALQGAVALR